MDCITVIGPARKIAMAAPMSNVPATIPPHTMAVGEMVVTPRTTFDME
jgi:hypothetical protein